MLAAYTSLLSVPGAPLFVAGSALSRIGGAMFGVSIIVMVQAREGSYALAGAVSAAGVIVLAVASPFIGAMVDRYGQRRASLPFILIGAVGGFATAALSLVGAPVWTVFFAYALSAFLAETGPMSRARWAFIFEDDEQRLHTAMSFEQVVEELCFVIGPVLAVLVSTQLFPEAGLILAELLFTLGAVLFLAGRSTEPPVTAHHERPPGLAIRNPGMIAITTAAVMVGVIFGGNEVVAVAVAEAYGNKNFSSVILGAFALASAIAGLVYGARSFTWSLSTRMLVTGLGMFVLQVPAIWAPGLWWITLIMFVAGSATAPTLINALSLIQRIVPRPQLTEGMAVGVTGLLVGISIGTSVSGWAVEAWGAQTAYVVPAVAGAVAVLVVGLNLSRLHRAETSPVVGSSGPTLGE